MYALAAWKCHLGATFLHILRRLRLCFSRRRWLGQARYLKLQVKILRLELLNFLAQFLGPLMQTHMTAYVNSANCQMLSRLRLRKNLNPELRSDLVMRASGARRANVTRSDKRRISPRVSQQNVQPCSKAINVSLVLSVEFCDFLDLPLLLPQLIVKLLHSLQPHHSSFKTDKMITVNTDAENRTF